MNARLLIVLTALGLPAWAQTAATAPSVAASASAPAAAAVVAGADAAAPGGTEPNVRVTVIEERGTRIEETRVRGQLTRISVRPADGTTGGYEFLPQRDLRDDADGRSGSSSAVGKRVWRVLAF